MKKTILYSLIITLVFSVSGCARQKGLVGAPEPTAAPTLISSPKPASKASEYDKYKVSEAVKGQLGLDDALYNKIIDAVDTYQPNVPIGRVMTLEELEKLNLAVLSRYEFSYLTGMTLSEDGQTITFVYNMEKEPAMEKKNKYRAKVEAILADHIKHEYNQFEMMISLYRYFAQSITFTPAENMGAYSAIVDGQTNMQGIVYGMQTLLDQIGIENHVAAAKDNSQLWNVVKLDGKYYHFDMAMENKSNKGQRLLYFGMTDEERRINVGFKEWHLGFENKGAYLTPECTNGKFLYLRNVGLGYGVDFEAKLLYFSDVTQDGLIKQYSYLNNAGQELFGKRSGSLVYHKGFLYFADTDSRNQLYKMDIKTGTCELLDSIFVTRMFVKNNELIYFDDVSSSEKSIVLP